jgi:stage II sporulation protein D
MRGETAAGTRAVESTRGVLALYRGRPIRANYSSTCGGITESSERAWPGEAFPYLRSVRDRRHGEDLCAWSPYHRWTETWDCDELKQTILRHLSQEIPEAAAHPPTRIDGIKIGQRSPSGRVKALEIRTDTGTYQVRGDRIRWLLRRSGGGLLRSTRFGKLHKEKRSGCQMMLEGSGYGHGVGMCQTGAITLARQGLSASQILRHYYRSIKLGKWW